MPRPVENIEKKISHRLHNQGTQQSKRRSFLSSYLFVSLPALLTVGGWKMGVWAYDYYGCEGIRISDDQPCFAGGMNILPVVGFGMFWCQILSWFCVPISGGLLVGAAARQMAAHWKHRDR